MKTNEKLYNKIAMMKTRSAWKNGVKMYALDLIEQADENEQVLEGLSYGVLEKILLNGATNWHEYSWGGCSLIYDELIARRLCSQSELKKTNNGQRKPNSREEWLDVQARALFQAFNTILENN